MKISIPLYHKQKVTWTDKEDKLILSLSKVKLKKKWKYLSQILGYKKTSTQCFARYHQINPSINKGNWRKEEDRILQSLILENGKKWSLLAKIMKTRTAKQIRERYINMLDPCAKKDKFSLEEDLKVLNYYELYGNRWSLICKFLPGRSQDKIKNRYNSSIRRNANLLRNLEALDHISVKI